MRLHPRQSGALFGAPPHYVDSGPSHVRVDEYYKELGGGGGGSIPYANFRLTSAPFPIHLDDDALLMRCSKLWLLYSTPCYFRPLPGARQLSTCVGRLQAGASFFSEEKGEKSFFIGRGKNSGKLTLSRAFPLTFVVVSNVPPRLFLSLMGAPFCNRRAGPKRSKKSFRAFSTRGRRKKCFSFYYYYYVAGAALKSYGVDSVNVVSLLVVCPTQLSLVVCEILRWSRGKESAF